MSKKAKSIYSPAVDNGETIYKIWCAEDRKAKEGYDLIVFASFKKEFLKDKLVGKNIDDFDEGKEFVLDLAKEKEIGTYFHNSKGAAYGAAKKYTDGRFEPVHSEYWTGGKRLIEESEIKRLIHDVAFSENVNKFINE